MNINLTTLAEALTKNEWLCKGRALNARSHEALKEIHKPQDDKAYHEARQELERLCQAPPTSQELKTYSLAKSTQQVLAPLLSAYQEAKQNPEIVVRVSRAMLSDDQTDGKVILKKPGRYLIVLTTQDPKDENMRIDPREDFYLSILPIDNPDIEIVTPKSGKLRLKQLQGGSTPIHLAEIGWKEQATDNRIVVEVKSRDPGEKVIWFGVKAKLSR